MNEEEAVKAMHEAIAIRDEWSTLTKLAYEKEALGIYVTDHPLRLVDDQLEKFRTLHMSDFEEADETDKNDDLYKVAGLVTEWAPSITKSKKTMVRFMLDDMTGVGKVTVFPTTLDKAKGPFGPDVAVKIGAALEDGEFGRQLIAKYIESFDIAGMFDQVEQQGRVRVHLKGANVSMVVLVPEESVENVMSEAKERGMSASRLES